MKKFLILISLISLISCSKKIQEEPKKLQIAKNIVGIVESIDKNNLSLSVNGETIHFNISDISFNNIAVNDEISVVYNGDIESSKVVSLILQNKAIKSKEIIHLDTVIEEGTNYEVIVVNNGLRILINDVPIEFEGSLVKGMKVSIDYLSDVSSEYDGILQSLKIIE